MFEPTIDDGRGSLRRDMLAECGRCHRCEEDFSLVRDLGLSCLRYGLPYHLVNPEMFELSVRPARLKVPV